MKGQIEIKVRGYHVDGYSHVNNARYMEFLEEARWALAETDTSFMELRKTGYAFTAVNININYTSEACAGDTLIITTELKTTGRKSITLSQKIYKKSDAGRMRIIS